MHKRYKTVLRVHNLKVHKVHTSADCARWCIFKNICPPSPVGKGGHTLLLRGGRRGFDPHQLRRIKRSFFPPLAIWNEALSLYLQGHDAQGAQRAQTA
jgi:hypothetical protein